MMTMKMIIMYLMVLFVVECAYVFFLFECIVQLMSTRAAVSSH